MRLPSTTGSEPRRRRRQFLRAIAVGSGGAAVSVAGCISDDETADDDSADDPTTAVERYFEAIEDGDRETANRYAHEDGDYYIDDGSPGMFERALEADEITLSGPEEVSLETAVENKFDDDSDVIEDAIADEKAAIETLQEEYTFDNYAYVRHEAETEDGLTFDPMFLLFETGDGWLVWSLPTIPPQQAAAT